MMNFLNSPSLKSNAEQFGIPVIVVQGITQVESNGNPWAFRSEPGYRYLYNPVENAPFRTLDDSEIDQAKAPDDFPYFEHVCSRDSEWSGQRISWGPMQVMGAVARERGFKNSFPELCSLNEGTLWGCKHLRYLADRFIEDHGWAGVVSAYNQGSPRRNEDGLFFNQDYVDRVFLAMTEIDSDDIILRDFKHETSH